MLNLGGLFFTLDANTQGLTNAQRRVERFANDVRQAFRGVERGTVSSGFANGLLRQERAVMSMFERIKRAQDQIGSSGLKGNALRGIQQEFDNLSRGFDNFSKKMNSGVRLNNLDYSRRIQHMTSQMNDFTRSLRNAQAIGAKTAWGNAIGGMHQLGSAALVVNGHFGGLSTRLFAFGNLTQEVGFKAALLTSTLAGTAAGLGVLGTAAVKTGIAMERVEQSMQAVTGNAAVAAINIAYVKDVANQAGLVFEDTAKAYARFLAASSGVISTQETEEAFRGVSLAAAKMQLSVEDTQGVFRALEQIMSKGTVQAEELRGQLGDRLPGAFKIAASAMGVTTRELSDMTKKGELLSQEFIPRFVKELERVYNIDTGANIDTITASLGRLSNEWTYFSADLNKATGASVAFKAAVNLLIDGLRGIRSNLPDVIRLVGAAAGAMAGLGVAMAIPTLAAFATGLWAAGAAAIQMARSAGAAAAAVNLLNVAIAATPAGRIISILGRLAIMLGGTAAGYLLLDNMVGHLNESLNNTSDIENYIKKQREMGFHIRSTTDAMMDQVRVQAKVAEEAAVKSGLESARLRRKPGVRENLLSGLAGMAGYNVSPQELASERIKELEAETTKNINEARRTAKLYADLQDMNKTLPDEVIIPTLLTGDDGSSSKAKKVVEKISDIQRAYEQFVDKLTTDTNRLATFNKQFDHLAEGGNPLDLGKFDDLFDAMEDLKDFSDGSAEAAESLNKIRDKLTVMGYAAGTTGDLLKDTQTQLASLYTTTSKKGNLVRDFTQLREEILRVKDELAGLESVMIAFSQGAGTNIFGPDGVAIAEETERAIDRGRKVNEFRKVLQGQMADQLKINEALEEYLGLLRGVDVQKDVIANLARSAEANRDAMRSMVNDGLMGFKDLITGVKSLGDALQDLASAFLDTLWQRYIIGPANNFLDDLALSSAKQQTVGVDRAAAGLAANDNGASAPQALNDLTSAAKAAAGATGSGLVNSAVALATQLGFSTAATTVEATQTVQLALQMGILTVATQLAAQALMALAAQETADTITSAISAGAASGRAFGGPINAGQIYRINEPGVMGEYFMSSTNGYMNRESSNSNGPVYINANTTIDARGASKEAVAELRQEMAARDQTLRKELPYMVDARVRQSSGRGRYG